jgi:hypothetical protein
MQGHIRYASGRLNTKPGCCRIQFTIPVATAAINSKSCLRYVNQAEHVTYIIGEDLVVVAAYCIHSGELFHAIIIL